ncbi:CaiB/BaiF CoA-transferase family protein [Phaeobacter sp.]|uniref:CaiB/BaiF CoA transferase family protein n=1 Tax=Phaeobacter sp. TaxID=1902409 RepID=UPI0025EBC2EF|nr:CaiB/BaiF CoA-transferase family protein [Phaeobacter sp.]
MLQGIRIIEIEGLGPGPFAAMMLADLGANVICVHRKGKKAGGMAPPDAILDRGKRSIALDLKDPDDVAILLQLIETADGLIEGFRPGVMERLGLGPEICHARNGGLIYGRMTGWGQNSAFAHMAGHDLNYIAMSGALWHSSPADVPPFATPTLIGDIGGGALYLVAGLLAALLARPDKSHGGCVVDAAIYDGSAHMMNLLMTLQQAGHFGHARGANLLDGPHWSRTYVCSDGAYISVQCLEPPFYATFLDRLGLADDPEFAHQYDKTLWPRLTARLAGLFASHTQDHWATLFQGTDACVAPVLSPEAAAQHPMNDRRTWITSEVGLQAAPAPRFTKVGEAEPEGWTPPKSPKRGEHTAAILDELRKLRR